MAVYEVLVSVTPSVHVVQAQVQVQARQTKQKKNQNPSKLNTSQKFTKKTPKKPRPERLKKAKGRTLDCNTYKEKEARMRGYQRNWHAGLAQTLKHRD